jgi:hypothetical protein
VLKHLWLYFFWDVALGSLSVVLIPDLLLCFLDVFLNKPVHGIINYHARIIVSGHFTYDACVYKPVPGTGQSYQEPACPIQKGTCGETPCAADKKSAGTHSFDQVNAGIRRTEFPFLHHLHVQYFQQMGYGQLFSFCGEPFEFCYFTCLFSYRDLFKYARAGSGIGRYGGADQDQSLQGYHQ